MSTEKIANRLVELVRQGESMKAYDELFDENAEAFESGGPNSGTIKGLSKLREKSIEWFKNVEEMHSMEVSDPIVCDGYFACSMNMDITFKQGGRMAMNELCLYEVKDGKIAKESFYYQG